MDPSCASWNGTAVAAHSGEADTHAATMFLAFNVTVLSLTLTLGLPGNLLVLWVLYRTRSVRTSNVALLVNLAAGDLLKCSLDTPLMLFSLLRYGGTDRYRDHQGSSVAPPVPLEDHEGSSVAPPVALCALQQLVYVLCSVVQLLTLVAISVERFHAIAHPFQSERRKMRVRRWILSVWPCGLILAVVSLTTLSKRAVFFTPCRRRGDWGAGPNKLHGGAAGHSVTSSEPSSGVWSYMLVALWGCSLTAIVLHYLRIFRIVRRRGRTAFDSGVRLRPAAAETGRVWSWLSLAAPGPRAAPGLRGAPGQRGASRPRTAPRCNAVFRSVFTSGPRTAPAPRTAPVQCTTVITVEEATPPPGSCVNDNRSSPPAAPPPRPEIVGAVCLLTPHARERGKKRVEGRLAKRFGYIIVAFTLFWMPMVVTLIISMVSTTGRRGPKAFFVEVETSAMVLTCVPAAVDPLLYAAVTRQFRNEFGRMLSSVPRCPLRRKT